MSAYGAEAIADHLSRTKIFGPLAAEGRQEVARRMQPAAFSPGQMIFSRGDEGRGLYLILSGRVRLSILTEEGRELSFAHATPGHVFGEIAALDGGLRTADATALTKVEAAFLPQAALRSLIASHPGVAGAAIGFLCARLRETDQKLEAIALHPIEVRLARLLLSAIEAREGPEPKGVVSLDLGISQSEISLLIGASRPKVNAALALLEGEGAFRRSGASFRCNVETLRRRASAE